LFGILFFENAQGYSSTDALIQELDKKAKTDKAAHIELRQIYRSFEALEKMGTLQNKFTKHIREELWELKAGKNRILFFGCEDNNFVILHYFKKTTNKTPQHEIQTANRRIKAWKNNSGKQ